MKLYIKYMVSTRCKALVAQELKKLGVQSQYVVVDLGAVDIAATITPKQRLQLKANLRKTGLEVLDNKKSALIDKVQKVISEMIHNSEKLPALNYSDYISEKLRYDYTYLANMFTEVKGITIQQYIILQKTERVKDLLIYDELTLTQIAHKLQYSRVAHMSNQFKKVTGLSPSYFKQFKHKRGAS